MAIASFSEVSVGSRVWFTRARREFYARPGVVDCFRELPNYRPGVLLPLVRFENGETHFAKKPAELQCTEPSVARARRLAMKVQKKRQKTEQMCL